MFEKWQRRLAEAMDQQGAWPERSPWIRSAMEAVPRQLFAPDRLWRWNGDGYAPLDREAAAEQWAAEIYGRPHDPAVTQVTAGRPTSSLSAPSIVADMLDSLLLEPGQRVLELGTGTGWNAALLARRAGPGLVHSVENDPGLAEAAAERLGRAGAGVTVHTGDGTDGRPGEGPYDRVQATFAVEDIPWAWVAQTRPGGRIGAPWGQLGHVALTVAEDGQSATGWFQGYAAFMPTFRAERRLTWSEVRGTLPPEDEHRPDWDVRLLQDGDLLFTLRIALPDVDIAIQGGEQPTAWLHDGRSSWAKIVTQGSEPAVAYQGGPRRLLDELRTPEERWRADGRPSLYDFGMTVEPDRQFVWYRDPVNGQVTSAA
ncbi:methyltransferase domain-containing protein [Streptomyces sp. NPDC088725]|uniref:methyltransferase domain-containing protein n=1 Tax=Streptomyces sp. NPDC088725 TaxID=3365873 RepID=UPI003815A0CB